ncbi:Nucleolar protein 10 [Gryllus bimaculatus]|nr:Nucleolar protein 10 [Gryllus bimaculatus]
MQVSDPNNVKIYNLSAGKSLPDWLSEKKRRALQKKSVDIRRRIELIQDFEMPGVSTTVKVSPDGQYVLATGIYKPRVRCYDVNQLSMKFERCFDSEVVTFDVLSEDFSKLVFLHCDRYIEFHAAYGRYFRLRIPRFGRDMKYHYSSCDLFVVGAGPEVYRLNLERGQFLNSLVTEASEINRCAINPEHQLLVCGSREGRVEAWDTRVRKSVGSLDCAISCATDSQFEGFPSVTALQFQGALTMAVGTATGHILLYDLRANKPFLIKDHMYGLPILDLDFYSAQNFVLSMDRSILKIWDKNTGKPFTSIEATADFNNLCYVRDSGLMFIANENTKILTYYIPSMGPAPKWCSFLDALTEELEESKSETVYDDYKFVTKKELEELGLDHLIGTNLLRAYMHGYFLDFRLYKKAKSVADPFAFEEYKKKKIKSIIEEERGNRVKLHKLPSVNKELALKLMNTELGPKKKKKSVSNLLSDDRFKALFENPDFEVDKNAEEYRLLNPVLSRMERSREKVLKKQRVEKKVEEQEIELEGKASSDESSDSSSDDDRTWAEELRRQHRLVRTENRHQARAAEAEEKLEKEKGSDGEAQQPKFYELGEGEVIRNGRIKVLKKQMKAPLGQRVVEESHYSTQTSISGGSRQMTFKVQKDKKSSKYDVMSREHYEERKKLVRSAKGIRTNSKLNNWMRRQNRS